ncbi:hypothetical protein SODALDRAFT_355613 [Sodiomyces alkalinus F11]|uniref:Uncharacterized protein n=1 Tax=Sodiomyces alkalinus (strain CBS 110278 / VKM F-3762 / F11) TaxID=1314773 RepID=A0A3N2Q9H4_SODAK|nr:hypothetical protein SODALDRAFT_355613 [Sodiomyces alkalinus F11]ROT43410.1 hypothetical protein SODALDRAFT_355613 [Sodiomyces alkalinus F11]
MAQLLALASILGRPNTPSKPSGVVTSMLSLRRSKQSGNRMTPTQPALLGTAIQSLSFTFTKHLEVSDVSPSRQSPDGNADHIINRPVVTDGNGNRLVDRGWRTESCRLVQEVLEFCGTAKPKPRKGRRAQAQMGRGQGVRMRSS